MSEGKIPEKIKRYRPEKCSEVKFINGHYYVYRYKAVLLTSGKWGKKSGPCIGSIIPDVGFKPNKNYLESDIADSITVIDYGQYAFIEEAASSVRQDLEQCFTLVCDSKTAVGVIIHGTDKNQNGVRSLQIPRVSRKR